MCVNFTYLLLCIFTYQISLFLLQNSEKLPGILGAEKWKVVGLYSICSDLPSRTLFNHEAFVYKKTADFIYGNQFDRNTVWNEMFGTQFENSNVNLTFDHLTFDVCNEDDLVKAVLGIFPNETFYVNNKTENPPLFNGQIIENWKQKRMFYSLQHFCLFIWLKYW